MPEKTRRVQDRWDGRSSRGDGFVKQRLTLHGRRRRLMRIAMLVAMARKGYRYPIQHRDSERQRGTAGKQENTQTNR